LLQSANRLIFQKYRLPCEALATTSYEIKEQQKETRRVNEQIKRDIFLKKLIFQSTTSILSMCALAFVFCFPLFLAVFSAEVFFQHGNVFYAIWGLRDIFTKNSVSV